MSQIGYMMLAAGLGPAGYAFAIVHLITHGFFKANMFLGAGSVMHAHERRREHAPLRRAAQGACRSPSSPSPRLPRDHRHSAVRPASSPRTRSSRRRSATNVGSSAGAALLGAGITAFYMSRVMLMTFFGEKRWRGGRPSARVARGDDVPLIVLAVAVGARRARCSSTTGSSSASRRWSASPSTTSSPIPALAITADHRSPLVARRRRDRLAAVSAAARSRATAPRTSPRHPRCPRRPVRRRAERGAADAPRRG